MAKTRTMICPYCGEVQPASESCRVCSGFLDALSRQATHNAMGPWFIRDGEKPTQPGCSYETLVKLIQRGQVKKNSIVRGPTTRQFWNVAKRVPGIAHLFGYCHSCDASVDPGEHGCHACGVAFGAYLDRNFMGLPDVRSMPWDPDMGEDDEMGYTVGRSLEWGSPGGASTTGGSVSSFATDEELYGDESGEYVSPVSPLSQGRSDRLSGASANRPAPAMTGEASTQSASATEPIVRQVEVSPIPIEGYAVTAATRAMQRRIERQKRQIRILVIATIVLVGVGLATNFSAITGLFGGGTGDPTIQKVEDESGGASSKAGDDAE